MLGYFLTLLAVGLIAGLAGVLGFPVLSATAATTTKVLVPVFIVLTGVSLVRNYKPSARTVR